MLLEKIFFVRTMLIAGRNTQSGSTLFLKITYRGKVVLGRWFWATKMGELRIRQARVRERNNQVSTIWVHKYEGVRNNQG